MKHQRPLRRVKQLLKRLQLINCRHINQPALLTIGELDQRQLGKVGITAHKLGINCQLSGITQLFAERCQLLVISNPMDVCCGVRACHSKPVIVSL